MPNIGSPENIRTVRVKFHGWLRRVVGLTARLVIVDPVFDLLAFKKVPRVRNRGMGVARRQPHVANGGAAYGLVIVCWSISEEIAAKGVEAFLESGELLY